MRISAGQRLVLATHNPGKLNEFAALLLPFGIRTTSSGALGLPVPEETAASFVENARIKARVAARETGLLALADDSGLTIDALDGAPGVYTADWAMTPTGRDYAFAMRRMWSEMETRGAAASRRAQFRCSLVLAHPDGSNAPFEGVVEGQIVWPGRGAGGHGYDPIFQPDGYQDTFAEMRLSEKNRISHRARAIAAFIKECLA